MIDDHKWNGEIGVVLLFAVAVTAILAQIVAAQYRKAITHFIKRAAPPPDSAEGAVARAGVAGSLAVRPAVPSNIKARRRVALMFIWVSVLIAVSLSWLEVREADSAYGPLKVVTWASMQGWVVVPTLGLLWRWTWLRSLAWSVAYMALAVSVVWLRSGEQDGGMVAYAGESLAAPFLMLAVTTMGGARTTGPYLLPIVGALCLVSSLSLDVLTRLINQKSGFFLDLVEALGAYQVMALFALAPWLLAIWPVARFSRAIGGAYRAKVFSEAMYLFAAYWLIVLLVHSLTSASALPLLCWFWIPLGFGFGAALGRTAVTPPILLVLRVFKRDDEARELFDSVIERWRYSAPACLIGAADLAPRTLGPDQLFAFLGGRLAGRFVASEGDLERRLTDFDSRPDPDGRYRVNEFYCYDTTWRETLAALADRADLVLMDLRGFKKANAGCLHELRTLAEMARPIRVVVLVNSGTDEVLARETVSASPARFEWLQVVGVADPEVVLGRLFA